MTRPLALALCAGLLSNAPCLGAPFLQGGDLRRARQAEALRWAAPRGPHVDPNEPGATTPGAEATVSGLFELGFRSGTGDPSPRLGDGERDGPFLSLERLSLFLDGTSLRGGRRFHLQLDALSARDGIATPRLSEAWLFMPRLSGKLGAKVGAFAPPFSREHGGPGRSTVFTITPSALSARLDGLRMLGMEWRKTPEPPPNHLSWTVSAGAAADRVEALSPLALFDGATPAVDRGEDPWRGASWVHLGKDHSDSCSSGRWGWHASVLDLSARDGAPAERMTLLSVDWFRSPVGLVAQAGDGRIRPTAGPAEALFAHYLMAHGRLGRALSASVRHESWRRRREDGFLVDAGRAWTFALNRRLGPQRLLQLEGLRLRTHDGGDDGHRVQLRLRVRF